MDGGTNRDAESIRVLHVDDDGTFGDLARASLQRVDDRFDVTSATSAADALDVLGDDGFDCVVSDYEMPDTNGIEFLETVRERDPDLPFILYTGKGSEEVASDAISAGVTDYLQKGGGTDQYAVLANRVENAVQRRRSERALAERNRRLETLISNLPGLVYRCRNEPAWPMEFVGGECRELSGYAADALESGDVRWGDDVISPGDRDDVWEAVQDAVAADDHFEITYTIRTRNGERKDVWERGRGIRRDGDVHAIEGFITDVTQQRERQRRLERSTERLEALFENSPDMVNVHDADGVIVDANDRFCEELGYAADEVVGMSVWDVDTTADHDDVQRMRAEMDRGDLHRFDAEFERCDGSTFPVEVHLTQLEVGGDPQYLAISRDVTEFRRRERALRRERDKLDQFADVVSHDLRNPLNVAEGNLELAREDCDSDRLDTVANVHDRMRTLVDDVLALARDADTVTDPDTVTLDTAAERAWSTVETDAGTLTTASGVTVRAGESRLVRLLENLFRNAVEHARCDGVTVRVGALDGADRASGDPAAGGEGEGRVDGFFVADDGPGIPEDDRERVFESGYSTNDDGTGLGLTIVAEIADAHGWDVRVVESETGGTRVEVADVETA